MAKTKTVMLADNKEIVIKEITAGEWWDINKKSRSFNEGKWTTDDALLQELMVRKSVFDAKAVDGLSVPDLLVVVKEVQDLNFPAAIAKKLQEQLPQESPEI